MMRVRLRRTLALAALLLAVATGLEAQQQPAPADTGRTPEEQIRDRLRQLRPVAAPDTQQVPDSTRAPAQGFQVERRAAAGESGIERDSVMQRLARLSGYVATEYRGGEALFQADSGRLQLRRDAEVVREGQRLHADTLIDYNESTGIACGFGRPTISGESVESPLSSDTVCYNIESQLGVARNAETSISQGANWQMRTAALYTRADSLYAHDAQFTDCELPWPHKHYTFEAGKAKVIQNNVMVARDVTLKFADVPVFWLPFMVQSLSRGRRSGILMPRFGINDIARTNARYSRRIEDVGLFWAISDYMGAEVAMDWMSDNYTALRGSLDYRVERQFLNGGLTFRRYWKNEGGTELTLSSSNSWQPNEFTRLGMNANYSTSSAFVRRRTLDPRELTRSIDSNLNLNRQFGWGSLTLGATRNQYLTDGTVRMTLPSFGLTLNSVTLFAAEPGEESWYNNATWSGTLDGRVESTELGSGNRDLNARSRRNASTNLTSRFSLGKFGLSQDFRFAEDRFEARRDSVEQGDSIAYIDRPEASEQRGTWGLSASYQQNLIGTTTSLTPSLRLNGEFARNEKTADQLLTAPMRLDFSASLQTALFGFWPGVGPIQTLRHRISPSFNYTYSPEAKADSLQRAVFSGLGGVKERNQLSIGVSQTFEGKRRARAEGEEPEPVGAMGADTAASDTTGGLRRLPPGESPIMLLSISTDAVMYDFVAAREGDGIQTTSISNSIQSDLFRNLQLRFTHELFRPLTPVIGEDGEPLGEPGREFKPHLSNVSASFRMDSDSWLFRALGLGRGKDMPEQQGEPGAVDSDSVESGVAIDRTKAENGMVGTRRRDPVGVQGGPVGSWNASFDYTLDRPRDDLPGASARGNQMVTANMQFQPTLNWTMMWRTGYNFTIGGFTDHILTLTRRLHDWDASFDFVKAQNGNFSFQFRVHLRANPDIKLDYEQHDMQGLQPGRPRTF